MTDPGVGFRTRIGTVVGAAQTPCYSGRRDIGGSVVNAAGRVVLAVGPSDCFNNTRLVVAVSDDGGESFSPRFSMPALPEVSYHTTGMLYDQYQDVLMALFGETRGFKYWKDEDDYTQGREPFSADREVRCRLMMARSVDGGETWRLYTLYDYAEQGRDCLFHGGIVGCGVQVGADLFVPQIRAVSWKSEEDLRFEVLLSRVRNLSREQDEASFEFEHDFRTLADDTGQHIPYADETVYLAKLDGSGFVSFHRNGRGMPFRREYDNRHNPVSDFARVRSAGFDPRDYDPGVHGPVVIAFNVVRLPDGNLMMASRFYGTEHHRPGNILLTSRDEGLSWDYHDDQIPYSLQPLLLAPGGSGGNPSMSYLPDASLIHSTSSGCEEPLGDSRRVIGSTLIARFQGLAVKTAAVGEGVTRVSVDVSGVAGLEPLYIARAAITGSESVKRVGGAGGATAVTGHDKTEVMHYSAERRSMSFDCRITGADPWVALEIVLANRANAYRPIFRPVVQLH